MAVARIKKDWFLKDKLTKPTGTPSDDKLSPCCLDFGLTKEAWERPVTGSFMETLFSSPREDIQALKRDLSVDLKDVRLNLMEIGIRVSAMENSESGHEEEVEQLHQEVLRLKEQHVELQAHTEDLENRSHRNNVPLPAEGIDLQEYVRSLFCHILSSQEDVDIQLDYVHRVGLPRQDNSLACGYSGLCA
ncbi:hypothetical protein NDU88_002738 [Pleurodeles waltl]|uniref:Uncharacterized protein n=1 Tax=Pleurodeles waltl TaxID=8319 RepID=A0AAV7T4I7_PLEWA|nr:hypothetical protein NDU88_002738 [Pleurodeles waltl]